MTAIRKYWISLIFIGLTAFVYAQPGHEGHNHPQATPPQQTTQTQTEQHPEATTATSHDPHAAAGHSDCGHLLSVEPEFNAGDNAVHHIADANAIHVIGDTYINLPCILYAPGHGWKLTTTAAFDAHHHGNGEYSEDGYVLVHGNIMRFQEESFAQGRVKIDDYAHQEKEENGKTKYLYSAIINGECHPLLGKSTLDGGLMGGGLTNFYDYSITRNVFTMLLTVVLLFLLFRSAALAATRRRGQAPKGLQNFLEPFVTFIRDEVAKPNIGPKYEKYMPYLLSAFFFILGLNLIGQIPFFPGGANVTGNISITIILAIITFLITNLSGNKHYWGHIVWMPGVPAVLKILLITPIEILGIFLKPITLLLRLFANISAGHIVILSFVSMIFILGKAGESVGGSVGGMVVSIPLTIFMSALELLVAFLQAFIFTMLSATYIGSAIEEHHHTEEHH